jgi:DNA-binding CsgD family transcriptional regulator
MALLISELLVVIHFSIVFSITFFCLLTYYRTRDAQVGRFLLIALPLFLFTLIYFLHCYVSGRGNPLSPSAGEGLALIALIVVCLSLAAYVRGVVTYLVSIITEDKGKKRIGLIITNGLAGLFLLISVYLLILLNRDSWRQALSEALSDLFLYSSILLLIPTVVASIFLPRYRGRENYRLLTSILVAFYPMLLTIPVDILMLSQSPFKLTLITHSLFCGFFFYYILRHYLAHYETPSEDLEGRLPAYCRKYDISSREQEILRLLIEGRTNREIADALFISTNTVKTHVQNIYRKTGVTNRIRLIHTVNLQQS